MFGEPRDARPFVEGAHNRQDGHVESADAGNSAHTILVVPEPNPDRSRA